MCVCEGLGSNIVVVCQRKEGELLEVRDTVNNKVYFEKADYDKLLAEVPKVCCVFGRVTRR